MIYPNFAEYCYETKHFWQTDFSSFYSTFGTSLKNTTRSTWDPQQRNLNFKNKLTISWRAAFWLNLNLRKKGARSTESLATQPTCTWHPHPKTRIDIPLTLVHYERTRPLYWTQDILGGGSREGLQCVTDGAGSCVPPVIWCWSSAKGCESDFRDYGRSRCI